MIHLNIRGYVRPEVTFQDTLQNKDEMLKRLENYERVDDIEEVPLGTHIRYVTLDRNKKQVFRLGGILRRIHLNIYHFQMVIIHGVYKDITIRMIIVMMNQYSKQYIGVLFQKRIY